MSGKKKATSAPCLPTPPRMGPFSILCLLTVSLEYQLMCLPRLEFYFIFLLERRNNSYQSYFLIGIDDMYATIQLYGLT